jgi:peptide chain release factor 2
LQEIEKELSKPGAWDHPERLTPMLQEKSRLEEQVEKWEDLAKSKADLDDWLAMAEEEPSEDVLQTLQSQVAHLERRLERTELELLMARPEDKAAAILEIHPGAGGTEAQDWAEMLMRMYRRWAERHDYAVRYLDYLDGDEAGIKSVTLQVKGANAYGLLKAEKGIHRLIRISPYDASGRRHTSFASVDVYPDMEQDIEIEVKDEDLRIDVFRSSGPGGQSVNTTSSAVRITHEPTGLVVQCQNEKSQLRNKESALKILKARLYDLEMSRLEEERQAEYASKEAIAWGSQIRTYTLQPYRLVKDHRTNTEMGNVEAVLDGDLDTLIRDYLLERHAEKE